MSGAPPGCWWSCCGADDPPRGEAWLGPQERPVLAALVRPWRRTSWRLGRWAAKQALASYLGGGAGPALARLEILAAPDGAPEPHLDGEPLPVSLSISHRASMGASLVTPAGSRPGIDLERVEPRTTRMMRDFYTPGELARVFAAAPGVARDREAALVWSAKESLLKALRTGLRRDTRSVELLRAGAGSARIWRPLLVRDHHTGQDHGGWWRVQEDLVITVVASPRHTGVHAPDRGLRPRGYSPHQGLCAS